MRCPRSVDARPARCNTGGMPEARVVATAAGPVEVVHVRGSRPPVLFFPGGHSNASTDCGWDLYTSNGYGIVSFSRPGYGATDVGPLSAAEFAPAIREVCQSLEIREIAAVVGVSFGGWQAIHVAADPQLRVERLVLHSCAPSTLSYPDSRAQALLGPVIFSPLLQGVVWAFVRRLVRSDAGLRRMMAPLSTLPADTWWGELSDADKRRARTLFCAMRSDAGFVYDLRQGRPQDSQLRHQAISQVACPTLITGSRHDAGVAFEHAKDFAATIPGSTLVELDSPTHLFWIGPGATIIAAIVRDFIGR
jgi:pimeloyl-ACP methyl ester carboxylesterase